MPAQILVQKSPGFSIQPLRLTSLIWHGDVSKACEKVPALAQLKKWSLRVGDPRAPGPYAQVSYLPLIAVVFRDVFKSCGRPDLLFHLELFERS